MQKRSKKEQILEYLEQQRDLAFKGIGIAHINKDELSEQEATYKYELLSIIYKDVGEIFENKV